MSRLFNAITVSIVVVVALLATACAPTPGVTEPTPAPATPTPEVIELTFWHHEAPAHRVAAFQEVIDRFEAENPGIKVKQEVVVWGDAWPKTLAAIQAGNPPDFEFSIPDLTIFAYRNNGIIPVDDIVEAVDQAYKYIPSNLAMYRYQDHYWGVPIWTMPFVLIYRPSYLEKYVGTTEPPKTWDEWLEVAKKCTVDTDGDGKIDIYGVGLGGAKNLFTQEQVYSLMVNTGATWFDEEGNVVFNSPATIKALTFYKELYQYADPASVGWSWGELELNFAAGRICTAPYFGSLQKRFIEELESTDFAAAPQPYPEDGMPGNLIYPNDIFIFKQAEERGHLEAIKKFILFIMRPDINALLTAGQEPGAFVPVTEKGWAAPEYWQDPIISQFEELNKVLQEAVPTGKLYGFEHGKWAHLAIGDISGANILAEVVQKIVTGESTVEEAVAWGHAEMEKLVEAVESGQ